MAVAAELVSKLEVVRRTSRSLEESTERVDLVQCMWDFAGWIAPNANGWALGDLGRRVSILCYARGHDYCRCYYAIRWQVLRGEP